MEYQHWMEIESDERLNFGRIVFIAYEPNDRLCMQFPKAIPFIREFWFIPAVAIYLAILPFQIALVLFGILKRLATRRGSALDNAAALALLAGSVFAVDWIIGQAVGASFIGYLKFYFGSLFGG